MKKGYELILNQLREKERISKDSFAQRIINKKCDVGGCDLQAVDVTRSGKVFCQSQIKQLGGPSFVNIFQLNLSPSNVLQSLSCRKQIQDYKRTIIRSMEAIKNKYEQVQIELREALKSAEEEVDEEVVVLATKLLESKTSYCASGDCQNLAQILRLKDDYQVKKVSLYDWKKQMQTKQNNLRLTVEKILTQIAKIGSVKLPVLPWRVIKEASQANKKKAKKLFNNGEKLRVERKLDEAILEYKAAIEFDPKFVDAFNNLGYTLNELKRYDEAISNYRRAIQIDSKDPTTFINLGFTLNELKRYEEAIISYKRAIELDKFKVVAYNNLGSTLQNLKRYNEAIENYRKAIELNPRYALAYNNLGYILYQLGRYDEAVHNYQQAIEIDPKYVSAFKNLISLMCELGRAQQALAFQKRMPS